MTLNEFDEMTGYHMNSDNMNREPEKLEPIKHHKVEPVCIKCKSPEMCRKGKMCSYDWPLAAITKAANTTTQGHANATPQPSKYELLKDLPDLKAENVVFEAYSFGGVKISYQYRGVNKAGKEDVWNFAPEHVENNPEWFRKVEEKRQFRLKKAWPVLWQKDGMIFTIPAGTMGHTLNDRPRFVHFANARGKFDEIPLEAVEYHTEWFEAADGKEEEKKKGEITVEGHHPSYPGAVWLESVMPFGKFRGTKLANVPAEYLLWIYDNIKELQLDLRGYIQDNLEVLKKEVKK